MIMTIRHAAILFLLLLAITARATTFEGLSPADQEQLTKMFPDLLDQNPPLHILDKAIQQLLLLESYSDIQVVEDSSGGRGIKATTLKNVRDIVIQGNDKFDDEEIIIALGIKSGTRFDSGRLLEAGERLKEFYGKSGYFNAIVSFDIQDLEKNEVRILVKIRERDPCLMQLINIKTENAELKKKLQNKIKRYLNKPFTEENMFEIEETVNEILRSDRFLNTRLLQKDAHYNNSKTRVRLEYELTDPYSYEFTFNGNNHANSRKIITNLKLEETLIGSMDMGQDLSMRIRDFYLAEGFAHIKLSFTEKTIAAKYKKLIHFEINEGPRVKISSIDVVGRISRPSRYYSSFIFKNSSDSVGDNLFVRADLENGYKNLIVHLNNQGYIRAKIQSNRIEYNDKKDRAIITIILDEGPLTILSQVDFQGVQSFSQQQIQSILKISPNSPLRLNQLEESIQNIKKFYQERGFIEMKILNEDDTLVQYDERGLTAKVIFKVLEGPQVYIKGIVIDGNTFTKDYVVLREAGLNIGDLVTPDLLDETKKRIEKLNIFSRVELRTIEANTSIAQRTILISVTESNPGLIRISIGVTNKRDLTARGSAGLSYNNIGGTARAISLRGTLENNLVRTNYLEYEVTLAYLEPFVFDKRLRGRTSYTRSERIIEPVEDEEKINATDQIKFALEKDLTSQIKISWLLWGLDSVEQFNLPASGQRQRESRQEIAYMGPSLDMDYRDNPFLPTEGTFTKLDAEYSSPEIGSSDKIQFVRTQGTFTHYLRMGSPRVVWANSLRGGYGKNLNNEVDSGIPYTFAFFLGGVNTIRGYSGFGNDRIPSEREFPVLDQTDQLIIPKETHYYMIKSEIRFPLIKDPFGAVVFYDAGEVGIQGYTFERPFKQSAGVGIRINTPVGPLSLDYARKINPLDADDKDHWHLSIGTF